MNKRIRQRRRDRLPDHVTILSAMLTVCLIAAAVGCSKTTRPATETTDLFWPHAPEAKRIAFINTVSTPQDMGIRPNMISKVVDFFIGKQSAAIAAPYGIATDSTGRLYVVDTQLRRVLVFDAKGNRFSFFPKNETLLVSPVGIAIGPNDTIYITDAKAGGVQVFNNGGKTFIATLGEDIFKRPTGIAVNPLTNELLVVDTLQARVFRFELPHLRSRGAFGAGPAMGGGFHAPTQIATTPNGDIVVADALNFRVLVFNAEGEYRFQIGRMGTVPGTFSRPKGVAVDSDGNIYVVDALFDNVQVFDQFGRLLLAFGDHGVEAGQFWLPTDIFIDENDMVYVSDSANRRIQIFKYLKGGGTP